MSEVILYRLGPYSIPRIDRRRAVRMYLTNEGSDQPAPLLVMFDGQNIFHDAPSFSGGWHLHHAVAQLRADGLPAPVVVGVDHGNDRRLDELSPFKSDQSKGRFDALLQWLAEELVPTLRRDFNLLGAPEATVVGGSSMGGLASLYAHLRRPDVFGGAMAMSPAFWFAGARIFDFVAAAPMPRGPSRIYLDAGGKEDDGNLLAVARRMVSVLEKRGYGKDRLKFVAEPEGIHNEADWRRRSPPALRWLLKPLRAAAARGHRRPSAAAVSEGAPA